MSAQQAVLSLVLATMVFSVALDLKLDDFKRVLRTPRAVLAGLLPQFVLLPLATFALTLVLHLPANVEAALLLVACGPGGTLSAVLTHMGRGNAALSLSVSATAGLLALVLTPLNFSWMMAANPDTAAWLSALDLDPATIWWTLLGLLGLPMAAGLTLAHCRPALARRLHKPLARFAFFALLAFIVASLVRDRHLLTPQILPEFGLVVLHNAAGIALGTLTALALRLPERDRRAVTIEGGMQNAGFALGVVALQFGGDLGMVIVASLWGMWCIVTGLALAGWWRAKDARSQRLALRAA
jgi:BASS family bile acid:Na+ symporter